MKKEEKSHRNHCSGKGTASCPKLLRRNMIIAATLMAKDGFSDTVIKDLTGIDLPNVKEKELSEASESLEVAKARVLTACFKTYINK